MAKSVMTSKMPLPVADPQKAGSWGHAAGRIWVREKTLLGRTGFDRLFSLSSVDEIKRLLLEHGYPQQDTVEEMLIWAREELYELLAEIAPDDRFRQLLLLDDDAYNLKIALKTVLSGEAPEEERFTKKLSRPSLISHELLWRHAIRADKDAILPEWADYIMGRAREAFSSHYDFASIDRSVDYDIAAMKAKLAEPLKEPWLSRYFAMTRDLKNLETLLRAKHRKTAETVYEESLLPGGLIEKKRWIECFDADDQHCIDGLCDTPYKPLSSYFVFYREKGGAAAFAKDRDNLLYAELERGSSMLSGAQRVMAYFMARECEYKNIRLVLSILEDGLDRASVGTLRRDFQKR